jgi:large subunit ribosomal protein L31
MNDTKQGNTPKYRLVVFRDTSSGTMHVVRSTAIANETITMDDGKTYPLVNIEVSADSHPFYTGRQRAVGTHGQIEKFKRRFSAGNSNANE